MPSSSDVILHPNEYALWRSYFNDYPAPKLRPRTERYYRRRLRLHGLLWGPDDRPVPCRVGVLAPFVPEPMVGGNEPEGHRPLYRRLQRAGMPSKAIRRLKRSRVWVFDQRILNGRPGERAEKLLKLVHERRLYKERRYTKTKKADATALRKAGTILSALVPKRRVGERLVPDLTYALGYFSYVADSFADTHPDVPCAYPQALLCVSTLEGWQRDELRRPWRRIRIRQARLWRKVPMPRARRASLPRAVARLNAKAASMRQQLLGVTELQRASTILLQAYQDVTQTSGGVSRSTWLRVRKGAEKLLAVGIAPEHYRDYVAFLCETIEFCSPPPYACLGSDYFIHQFASDRFGEPVADASPFVEEACAMFVVSPRCVFEALEFVREDDPCAAVREDARPLIPWLEKRLREGALLPITYQDLLPARLAAFPALTRAALARQKPFAEQIAEEKAALEVAMALSEEANRLRTAPPCPGPPLLERSPEERATLRARSQIRTQEALDRILRGA